MANANFKLKGKNNGISNLELAPGWGLFVEEGHYQEHILQYVDQSEVCVFWPPYGWFLFIVTDQHMSIRARCPCLSHGQVHIWL